MPPQAELKDLKVYGRRRRPSLENDGEVFLAQWILEMKRWIVQANVQRDSFFFFFDIIMKIIYIHPSQYFPLLK